MEKNTLYVGNELLILKLLCIRDMYGYEIIDKLNQKSDNVFNFKTGTLYPILHSMEKKGIVTSYESVENKRIRKYYSITAEGRKELEKEFLVWKNYENAINNIINEV